MHRAAVNFKLKSLLFRMEVDQEGGVHRSVQGFRRHRLGVYYHRRRLWGPQVRVDIVVSSFLLTHPTSLQIDAVQGRAAAGL